MKANSKRLFAFLTTAAMCSVPMASSITASAASAQRRTVVRASSSDDETESTSVKLAAVVRSSGTASEIANIVKDIRGIDINEKIKGENSLMGEYGVNAGSLGNFDVDSILAGYGGNLGGFDIGSGTMGNLGGFDIGSGTFGNLGGFDIGAGFGSIGNNSINQCGNVTNDSKSGSENIIEIVFDTPMVIVAGSDNTPSCDNNTTWLCNSETHDIINSMLNNGSGNGNNTNGGKGGNSGTDNTNGGKSA